VDEVASVGGHVDDDAERVVAYYNHRGTAEQHIKEGKMAAEKICSLDEGTGIQFPRTCRFSLGIIGQILEAGNVNFGVFGLMCIDGGSVDSL
jgi:hypothetical protein